MARASASYSRPDRFFRDRNGHRWEERVLALVGHLVVITVGRNGPVTSRYVNVARLSFLINLVRNMLVRLL